jgi:hypothetical protein
MSLINELKLQQRLVFRVTEQESQSTITFREPTVGERISLEGSREVPGSSVDILKALVIEYTGDLRPETLAQHPMVVDKMLGIIYDKAPLFARQATEDLFNKITVQLDNDLIYAFKRWVAKTINYPDFMYLADDMSAADFLRYIRIAEETANLRGFFLYTLTGDDSKLDQAAKDALATMTGTADTRPDWERAGLKRPPANIGEKRLVGDFLKKEALARGSGQDGSDGAQIQPDAPNDQSAAIRAAGRLLAAKIKHEEALKSQGQPVPRFNFEEDQQLQHEFEQDRY